MNINRLLSVTALIIVSTLMSNAQNTIEIHIDSTKNQCIIIEINQKSKTFSQDILRDCRKAKVFEVDNGRILARWDTINDVHITLFSKRTLTRDPEELTIGESNISDILSVCNSIEKRKFIRNGTTRMESILQVEYVDKHNQNCSLEWDREWLMGLGKPICKSVKN